MWGKRTRKSGRVDQDLDRNTFLVEENKVTIFALQTKHEKLQRQLRMVYKPVHGRLRKILTQKLKNIEKKLHRLKTYDKNIKCAVEAIDSDSITHIAKQQTEILVQTHLHGKGSIPVFINTNICSGCNNPVAIRTYEASTICPLCAISTTIISDNHEISGNILKMHKSTSYNRAPLYRKFLMQFHVNTPPPPEGVISKLYYHLNKVHIMLPVKIKPTPICQILRSEGLQKWCYMAIRISKIMNREQTVVLSDLLIERLLDRFEKISSIYHGLKSADRKKILNFEYLTRQFLILEHRMSDALLFNLHKTRTVLMNADETFRKCCKSLLTTDTGHNWNFRRSY